MALRTKCIFDPKEDDDGTRISIMSRHTKNDGRTAEPRIIEGVTYDLWWKELSPPEKLVGWWYRAGFDSPNKERLWNDIFMPRFIEHIRYDGESGRKLAALSELALIGNVTIMCAESGPQFCHRRLVAEQVARSNSGIQLMLR